MDSILEIEHVSRDFTRRTETVHAVRDINLQIRRGSFNILCGRSGSGKTTLLNMIAAIDRPTSGRILFDGEDITQMSERKRDMLRRSKVGIVFQNTALIAQMSALENVEFALSVSGNKVGSRSGQAIYWLDRMGIRERRNHMPAEMSGGEQARVAIGRALAHGPALLLADEPTAELDSRTSYKVMRMFRELVDQNKLTVVMTTHDVNIMDMADYIYTMEDGVIVEERQGNQE